jgi:Flp pilus assembly protein TadG
MIRALDRLYRDSRGTMATETAIVMSSLLLLGLGTAQASKLVTQQSQMQAAVAQAEQIIAASKPTTVPQLDAIKSIMSASTGIPSANITVEFRYRCGTTASFVTTTGTCGTSPEWDYVHLNMSYTYVPIWNKFGIKNNVNLSVDRNTQIA